MKQLFVAWVKFQRRSASMQPYFGYELEFISFAFKNRILRPLEYILKSWKTFILFWREKPQIIWVQLPPTPLLYLAYLYKVLFNHQVILIADCHNATFRPPWISLPGMVYLLNRCQLVLVHNDWVEKQAVTLGVNSGCLHILEDPSVVIEQKKVQPKDIFPHPWILCPCSFNQDEPIKTILEAACLIPEITLVLTGNTNRAQGIHDLSNVPANVKLAGFLPTAEFDNLLYTTDVVLGLTKLEGVQLSVANEAVGAGKPMVLANTNLLKKLFYMGTIYVDCLDPNSIAQGCKEALSKQEQLTEEVEELRLKRNESWLMQASQVETLLNNCLNN